MSSCISVIIPIYNVAAYLDRCISSVCNQTYHNLQVLLVDDGSTDDSLKICDYYAAQDNRIQVIHKSNGGLVSARKTGLAVATGEYIAYVDGDDWIEPDLYERMIKEMQDSQVDLVESDAFKDMGNDSILMQSKIPYGRYAAEDIIPFMLCDEGFNECRLKPHVWSKLFKHSLLKEIQSSVNEIICLGEDVAVTYPYILKCRKIAILQYAGYHYVQRNTSIIYTVHNDEWEKNKTLILELQNAFLRDIHADILLPQLNQYAKLLLLVRHFSKLDINSDNKILMPYGGVDIGEKVIIYGAGQVGQSMYNYLNGNSKVALVEWVDKEYKKYQKIGFPVQSPETISNKEIKFDKIIIAVNSRKTAESIKEILEGKQVKRENILWLTDDFIQSDILKLIE